MLTPFQIRKLMKLFSMYDACNLGVLKLSDFERLAQRLAELRGWKPGSASYEQIMNKFLFRWGRMRAEVKEKVNHRMDSQIDFEEWLGYHDIVLADKSYRDEIVGLAESVFNVVDVDDSGHLSKEEWATLFRVYNIPVIYVDETFDKIDRNQDGALTKDEVLSMIQDFYYSTDPNAIGSYMFGPI
ncbi:MAG: EF-hand domain-containing protein [Elainellaceae cyanobacterium]